MGNAEERPTNVKADAQARRGITDLSSMPRFRLFKRHYVSILSRTKKMSVMQINYKITLGHDDFVLLLHVLKRAQSEGITNWDAAGLICENTKVEEQEQ